MMNPYELNKIAWNHAVSQGDNPYTQVISPEQVAAARQGKWTVSLSDIKPVPVTCSPN